MKKRLWLRIFPMLVGIILLAPASHAQSLHTVVIQSGLENFEETGKSRRCINFMKMERFKAITENELLFVEKGELYRNIPSSKCVGAMNMKNKFTFNSDGGRICRGSSLIIRSWYSGDILSVCRLGDFKLLKIREAENGAPHE